MGKLTTHPKCESSPYACIERLTDMQDDIESIVGVILYKDGSASTFNSPMTYAEQAYCSMLLQQETLALLE